MGGRSARSTRSTAALGGNYLEKEMAATHAVDVFLKRIASVSQGGPAINAVREVSGRALASQATLPVVRKV